MIKKILLICSVSFLCVSCFLFKSDDHSQWEYEKGAIELCMSSNKALNLYQKQAHSLILCAYQMRDLSAFNQVVDEKDGLPKLLECTRFDPSITYAKRLVVQPGLEARELMDRSEGAKYVGIVAGYYELTKENAVQSFQIPLSFFQNPKKLAINLNLGSQGIEEIKEK